VDQRLGQGIGWAMLPEAPQHAFFFCARLFAPAGLLLGSSLGLGHSTRMLALGCGVLLLAQSSSLLRLKNQASQNHRHA
jgi:hypothetical protein